MNYISIKHLKLTEACSKQVHMFKETFGDSVEFSSREEAVALAVKYAQVFDFDFMGKKVFKEAYEEAEAPLAKAYRESRDPLWESYEEVEALLLKTYKESNALLRKAYEEARAKIFAEMWWEMEQD